MREINFKVWHIKDRKMYFRGYQKLFHVLLCEDDGGKNEGKGVPVRRANYGDCIFLETTSLKDKNGREVFEGDIVRLRVKEKTYEGVVESVPDMFRSRKLHPLEGLFRKFGLEPENENIEIEVLGNSFESKLF